MTTEQAMADALKRPSVKKKVKAGTLRQIRKRLADGEMTLTAQVAFLKEHGYFVRAEINWGKPQRKKKGEYVTSDKTSLEKPSPIVTIEHDERAIESHAAKHGRTMEEECLNFATENVLKTLQQENFSHPACTACGYNPCVCADPNHAVL